MQPIPHCLESALAEGPFTRCEVCGADLEAADATYQIMKTWQRGEVVFEMALCGICTMGTAEEFSEESLARLKEWFGTRYRPSDDLDHCHFCGAGTDFEGGIEMAGLCRGGFLLRPPVVICAACAEASQEHLSDQTRRAWGDFLDRTLPGVPQEMEPDRFPIIF